MIGLALGGGGMKGLAHVGALTVIEAHGIRPQLIAGTSIGALVGAFYASGMPLGSIRQLFIEERIAELIRPRLDGKGLMGVSGIRELLELFLPVKTFDQLKIPFMAMACDVETGEEVILKEGSVIEAVLASIAIPGFFAPIQIGNRWLVDGGIVNNLPISALKQAGATQTIAIRLFSNDKWTIAKGADTAKNIDESLVETVTNFVLNLAPTSLKVLERALTIMIAHNEALHIALHQPDILIAPEVGDISIIGFHESRDPILERGIAAAELHQKAFQKMR